MRQFQFHTWSSALFEEYQSAITEQSKKADAYWYDFSDENIEKFLSD